MKNILFKIALAFWCIPLVAMARIDPKLNGKFTKEKTIRKEFKVNPDALLKLENSYGNLHIKSWEQNSTTIEVHIQTSSNNEKKAIKKLDEISVNFQASSSMVSAETIFNDSNWGWVGNNVSIQVNYTVRVPINNRLDISNDYGGIYIDEINGATEIKCDYGSMEIGKLNSTTNELSFDYTSDVSIDYINSARIEADYSSFNIQNAKRISLEADYSKANMVSVDNLDFTCEYGDIVIENTNKVIGEGDYLTTRIGRVGGDVSLNSDYGNIKINEMSSKAGNLTINGDYTDVEIGYNSGYHFDITAELEYVEFRGDNDFEYSIRREKASDSFYQGYYGSKGKNTVKLNIEYGGLKMIKR